MKKARTEEQETRQKFVEGNKNKLLIARGKHADRIKQLADVIKTSVAALQSIEDEIHDECTEMVGCADYDKAIGDSSILGDTEDCTSLEDILLAAEKAADFAKSIKEQAEAAKQAKTAADE